MPKGQVPASQPYVEDAAQARAKTSTHQFARASKAYEISITVTAQAPNTVNASMNPISYLEQSCTTLAADIALDIYLICTCAQKRKKVRLSTCAFIYSSAGTALSIATIAVEPAGKMPHDMMRTELLPVRVDVNLNGILMRLVYNHLTP